VQGDPSMVTAELLDAYGLAPPVTPFALEHTGWNNGNLGLRTGNGSFVLRDHASLSYADRSSIQYEQDTLCWLANQGLSFAVPAPIPTTTGETVYVASGRWLTLTPLLSGRPLARQQRDDALLGAALGEIQAALRAYPATPRPGQPLFGHLFRFPAPSHDPLLLTPAQLGLPDDPALDERLGWWRDEAARLHAFADGPYRRLPAQVCHNDVTPNNVHTEDGVITAVLDFEYTTLAARALDVATGLRLVLRHWEAAEPWPSVRAFCRGFGRWVHLADAEIAALPNLLRLRAASTVLWWIGRCGAGDPVGPIVADRITHLQNLARWLDHSEDRLLETVSQAGG
jgi:homoserine kinase type II